MATNPLPYSAAPQYSPATYSPAPPINQSSVQKPTPMPNYVQPKTTWQDMATSGKYGATSTTPLMGMKAKSPAANVVPPSNVLTKGQQYMGGTVGFDTATGKPLADGQTTLATPTASSGSTGILPGLTGSTTTDKTKDTSDKKTELPPSDISSSGLLQSLADSTRNNQAITDRSQGILANLGKNIQTLRGGAADTEGAYQTGMIAPRAAGLSQVVAQTEAAQEGALQKNAELQLQGETQALTGQSQTQSGLNQAAGYAQPFQVPYSNQLMQRDAHGNVVPVGTGGSLQSAVSGVADKIRNGTMTYNDGVSALGGYGQGGVNALQQALPPGFNVAQSNTLSGQQGSIGPAIQYANSALDALKSAFSNLQVPGQQSNVPLLGSLSGAISQQLGYGKEQTALKEGALSEARQAIQTVLASVKGGTPSDYTAQSHSILPDNATPSNIDAAKQLMTTLGSAKQGIYGNPGMSGTPKQGSSLFNF